MFIRRFTHWCKRYERDGVCVSLCVCVMCVSGQFSLCPQPLSQWWVLCQCAHGWLCLPLPLWLQRTPMSDWYVTVANTSFVIVQWLEAIMLHLLSGNIQATSKFWNAVSRHCISWSVDRHWPCNTWLNLSSSIRLVQQLPVGYGRLCYCFQN